MYNEPTVFILPIGIFRHRAKDLWDFLSVVVEPVVSPAYNSHVRAKYSWESRYPLPIPPSALIPGSTIVVYCGMLACVEGALLC